MKQKEQFVNVTTTLLEKICPLHLQIQHDGSIVFFSQAFQHQFSTTHKDNFYDIFSIAEREQQQLPAISNERIPLIERKTGQAWEAYAVADEQQKDYRWLLVQMSTKAQPEEDNTNRRMAGIAAKLDSAADEAFFKTILDEIPADIAIFSPDHTYLFVNKCAVKDPNVREWLIGKSDFEFCEEKRLNKKLAMRRRENFDRVIATQQPITFVESFERQQKEFHLRIMHPYVVNGEVKMVLGYGVNITTQKEQELALEVKTNRIRELLNTINDGIILCDKNGNIKFFNPAFARIMESVQPAGTVAINIADLVTDVERSDFESQLLQVTERNKTTTGIIQLKGTDRFLDYVLKATENPASGFDITCRISDITHRVHRERDLAGLVAKEKELSDLKTRFIRITSHEIRTPLTAILSNTELIQLFLSHEVALKKGVDYYKGFLEQIIKEVHRINELLAELVVIGRMEDGKEGFELSEGDIVRFTTEIIKDLFLPFSDGRSLEIGNTERAPLKALFCARMLRHAIVNVLTNAFKYSPGAPAPKLNIFLRNNDELILEIQDFGIGIPEDEVQKVTQSFYRATNAKHISGTGIGLMLVDYIVKGHNGSLEIYSQEGKGSNILIVLPLHQHDTEKNV